jgi:hypothetical protein
MNACTDRDLILRAILSSYHPDLVIYTHPDDCLRAFARLAVALQERQDPTFHPDMYAYLVRFPSERRLTHCERPHPGRRPHG